MEVYYVRTKFQKWGPGRCFGLPKPLGVHTYPLRLNLGRLKNHSSTIGTVGVVIKSHTATILAYLASCWEDVCTGIGGIVSVKTLRTLCMSGQYFTNESTCDRHSSRALCLHSALHISSSILTFSHSADWSSMGKARRCLVGASMC